MPSESSENKTLQRQRKRFYIICFIFSALIMVLLGYFSEEIQYFYYSYRFLHDPRFVKVGNTLLNDTPLIVKDGAECSKFELIGNQMIIYHLSNGAIMCGCADNKILFGIEQTGKITYFCSPNNWIVLRKLS